MQTVKNMDTCANLLQKCMEQGFSIASILSYGVRDAGFS